MTKHLVAKRAHQCIYGCCRATSPSGRTQERRWLKRRERQAWKTEIRGNL